MSTRTEKKRLIKQCIMVGAYGGNVLTANKGVAYQLPARKVKQIKSEIRAYLTGNQSLVTLMNKLA